MRVKAFASLMCVVCAVVSMCGGWVGEAGGAGLAERFNSPAEATRPTCYWYWMDGHITADGLTRDLEAMKHAGIGGAYIGIIADQSGIKANPEPMALTDGWWANVEHAIREAGRVGIDIGLFNSPGWSQSGGPWVKPRESMRYMATVQTVVQGPREHEAALARPEGVFEDVKVIAVPEPEPPVVVPIVERNGRMIRFEAAERVTVRTVMVKPVKPIRVGATLEVSEDGQTYRAIKSFPVERYNLSRQVGPEPLVEVVATFPAVMGRFFRLQFSGDCEVGDVVLTSAAAIEDYAGKSLAKVYQGPQPPFHFYSWSAAAEPGDARLVIDPAKVIDLTKQLDAQGVLKWSVPAGSWRIFRIVAQPTGTTNTPAPAEATGPEIDKMSRSALKGHFDAYIGEIFRRMPAADRRAIKYIVADSYETGSQNYTDDLLTDFAARYGYDPLPYLPTLCGHVVHSADASDRFLWDLRRMVADRIAVDYVGGLRDLCHQHGVKVWLENYGHWGFPSEFLRYGGETDEIGGEFWSGSGDNSIELRAAASAAHTYGKRTVWAEAFTGGPAFRQTFMDLKARGDWALSHGINQFTLHVYIHQPWQDKQPGINAWFGTEFNRHNTWFAYAKPWIDYLRRCTVMLQAGVNVADVAYYIGEDAPKMVGNRHPALPPGYDFDDINAHVIETRLTVQDGRFVLPDGTSYALLVLPDAQAMRPAVLQRIEQLVAAGGKVLAQSKPTRSPSLQNFPQCDEQVRKIADALWDTGRVWTNLDIPQAMARLKLQPDVIAPANILWKHRQEGATDIYFLADQSRTTRRETVSFRVIGPVPQLWWPETGRMTAAEYEVKDGRTFVTIDFDPLTSVFVVFKPAGAAISKTPAPTPVPAPGPSDLVIVKATYGAVSGAGETDVTARLASMVRRSSLRLIVNNDSMGGDPIYGHVKQLKLDYTLRGQPATVTIVENQPLSISTGQPLPGPWQVHFKPNLGGPSTPLALSTLADLSTHPDPAIHYYSGPMVYRTSFTLNAVQPNLRLDLGTVCDLAVVRVNGQEVGTLWKEPFALDIAAAAKVGSNQLEIEVVNTWLNRLIGDAQPGVAQRVTFTTHGSIQPQTPLMSSGLIGPVLLMEGVR